MQRKAGAVAFFLSVVLGAPSLAITVTNLSSTTPQQLAQLLAGPGVTVSNVTYTGANIAGGTFSGGLADGLGIDSGVMLTSGNVANGIGPNNQDGATTCNELPGDPALDALLAGETTTEDATVLEFDFVPSTNTVSFRYVFASEEYNEFVNSINDIFAFFIDGQNVALIPGTTTPVSINTVNLGVNSNFYRNNDPSDLGIPTPFATQFDGFTTVLTATATLTPNVSHHIKLVIADASDCVLDSAVFLQAGSFVGQPALSVSKTAPASVSSGSNLTYTLTYGNTGTENASNVVIRDPVPAGTTFVSATGGGVVSEAGVVTWNVGTVNSGVTGQTVSFTVQVNATSGSVTNSNYTIEATGISAVTGAPVTTTVIAGCPAINVSPTTLSSGSIGVPYSRTLSASGGTAPYSFSVIAGALPPGLSLSSSTGTLSGTPTAGGSFSFTVRAFDANECSGSRAYTISIAGGCDTLSVSPPALFEGFVGVPYRRTISGNGGTGPYSVSLTSGSLPPGLSLDGGSLSGTPTTAGTFTFRITVRDASDCTASRTYVLTIGCPPVALSPAVLAGASQGVAYNQTFTVLGGVPRPYTFTVTPGLPAGLTLSPTGTLSGVPAQSGIFAFTVTATDENGCATSQAYTLTVCSVLTVTPASLAGATVGVPYSQTLGGSGGTAPFTFAVTGGTVPPGLALSAAGALTGTPSAAGSYSFTVTATDAGGCTGVATYAVRVCPAVTITPSTLPGGSVGTAYSQALTAVGGTGPYVFTLASGSLPSGLAVSPGGVLSGTPTQNGTFSFAVTATDANGCPGQASYSLVVTDAPPTITSLRLSPGAADGFTLSIGGTGFVAGGTIFVNGVAFPATFVSPTLVTVALPASAIPANGAITVTVTNPGPTGATSNPASLTFCTAPAAPVNPTIRPLGNPTGPLTATDFLVVSWQPPASGPTPTSYEFRINGGAYTSVAGTSAVVEPRGNNDPITLHVRAKCNESVTGPEASSQTYSLAPPVADFTFSSARVGAPVTFTDTSSPQATSWLWIFDDGTTSTLQSPTHTFTTAGVHRVALIASNGSGSSTRIKEVTVSAATSGGGAVTSSARVFETSDGERWTLSEVSVSRGAPVWLHVSAHSANEVVVYLRYLAPDGRVALERRLSIPGGETAVNDVAAYGLDGLYTLELVSGRRIEATLRRPLDAGSKRSKPE
ncbi:MAG TPA: choice-of-anchor L domain-containing protein [Thermoanaerobaculia bacterium]|nr:choice-of-anchor L domain-containing protein [Thermoanaerobaculia bacterium]